MGNCFSGMAQEELLQSEDLNPDELSIRVIQDKSDLKKQKMIPKKKYRSELLNPNIKDAIINEEDSQNIANSYVSILEESLPKSRSLQRKSQSAVQNFAIILEYTQKHPLGQELDSSLPILLKNLTTGKYLHSHAIKYESGSKQHEVSGCLGDDQEYDHWLILCDHNGPVQDEDIIIMHHPLTKCNLRASQRFSSSKTKNYLQVCCVNSLQNIQNDDYWKIEILSDGGVLYENSLIVIKHVQTEGTLQVSKNRSLLANQNEIIVQSQPDAKEIWIVQSISD